jgi:hypothetical protein
LNNCITKCHEYKIEAFDRAPSYFMSCIDARAKKGIFPISGSVANGLVCRPHLPFAFYPLGSTVVVRHLNVAATSSKRQSFLVGHDYVISCVDLSESGKYLITGETHQIGTKVGEIINHVS